MKALALALTILATPVAAQPVGVVTDMFGGDAKMGMDLTALDNTDPASPTRVLWMGGRGSLENLKDILYTKGVDAGFMLSDTLDYARSNHLLPASDLAKIRYIAKLWDEEVHVLVRPEISLLTDLNGKKVNVDVPGSSSAMTADIVFHALGIKPDIQTRSQGEAMIALRKGEIDAIFEVGGAPVSLLANVPPDSHLHFIPVPMTADLAHTYLPTDITSAEYPNLVTEPVKTLAIGDVLAVFGWDRTTDRYRSVARFTDALFANVASLQKPPHHSKWRDVNLAATVPGWTRFQEADDKIKDKFMVDMQQDVAAKAGIQAISPELRTALFRDYERWRDRRKR